MDQVLDKFVIGNHPEPKIQNVEVNGSNPQHCTHLVKGHLKITVTVPLVLPNGLSERPIENYNVFPKFSNLNSWSNKFLFCEDNRRLEHRRKIRLWKTTFSYQFCSRKKEKHNTCFYHQVELKGPYVTVANQSTVHKTSPQRREIQYQRTTAQQQDRQNKYSCYTTK